MFAPHHQEAADELVRVARPGGTIGLLSWTPEGHDRRAVQDDGAVRPAATARRPTAAALGRRGAPARAVRRPGRVATPSKRDVLEITAFERPGDYGEHFKERYGPTIVARANAEKDGRRGRVRRSSRPASAEEWNSRHRGRRALRDGVPRGRRHPGLAPGLRRDRGLVDRAGSGKGRTSARATAAISSASIDASGSERTTMYRAKHHSRGTASRAGSPARPAARPSICSANVGQLLVDHLAHGIGRRGRLARRGADPDRAAPAGRPRRRATASAGGPGAGPASPGRARARTALAQLRRG